MISGILGKDLMKVVLVLQAVAAIVIGLFAVNVDVFAMMAGGRLEMLIKPLQIILGLSGVVGLLELVVGCGSCCD